MSTSGSFFYWVMLRKGFDGLYKAPTKEERRKQKAKRRELEITKKVELKVEACNEIKAGGINESDGVHVLR